MEEMYKVTGQTGTYRVKIQGGKFTIYPETIDTKVGCGAINKKRGVKWTERNIIPIDFEKLDAFLCDMLK